MSQVDFEHREAVRLFDYVLVRERITVPQAFTHLALISAAYNLDRALDAKG